MGNEELIEQVLTAIIAETAKKITNEEKLVRFGTWKIALGDLSELQIKFGFSKWVKMPGKIFLSSGDFRELCLTTVGAKTCLFPSLMATIVRHRDDISAGNMGLDRTFVVHSRPDDRRGGSRVACLPTRHRLTCWNVVQCKRSCRERRCSSEASTCCFNSVTLSRAFLSRASMFRIFF